MLKRCGNKSCAYMLDGQCIRKHDQPCIDQRRPMGAGPSGGVGGMRVMRAPIIVSVKTDFGG